MTLSRLTQYFCLLTFISVACNTPQTDKHQKYAEKDMDEIIHEIISDFEKTTPRFYNDIRLVKLKANQNRELEDELLLCHEYLREGSTNLAIEGFEKIYNSEDFDRLDKKQQKKLIRSLALCYLRYSEQLNCIDNHSSESCIAPISGSGIYSHRTYSIKALELYEKILAENENNLEAQWLYNVIYMTLGAYPDSVPSHRLIELPQEDSLGILFNNISSEIGILDWDISGASIVEDFNNDGYEDILFSSFDLRVPIKLYLQNEDGSYKKQENSKFNHAAGLNAIHGDVNNDGYPDVLILRGGWMNGYGEIPNSLLLNNGDGTFKDITIESGLLSFCPTQSGVFSDLNQDGLLDFVIANETQPKSNKNYGIEIYLNQGDLKFEEVSSKANASVSGFFKGVACGDINNDGYPDIYLSNQKGDNILLRNDFDPAKQTLEFTDVSNNSRTKEPKHSFPTWFWDVNNDGFEDIMVLNYASFFKSNTMIIEEYKTGNCDQENWPAFYINNGEATFSNNAKEAKLDKILFAMGANYGDINMDGELDFYVGTGSPNYAALFPNRLMINRTEEGFKEVTSQSKTGHLQKGHGISFADLDHDGDQDIIANMGGAWVGDVFENVVFENVSNIKNHFVILKLEGTKSNRNAIGARVKLTLAKADGSARTLYRTLSSGGSFGGNPLYLEIGLGDYDTIKTLEINWPNGQNEWLQYQLPTVNTKYEIKEGSTPVQIDYTARPFPKGVRAHHHHHH